MSRFEFHPKALEAISRRATRLLASLEEIQPHELGLGGKSFHPDTVPSFSITEAQILGPVEMERHNTATGEVSLIVLDTGAGLKALRGKACSQLDELINEVTKPMAISTMVGRPFIRATIKAWIRDHLNGKASDNLGFHIAKAVEAAVREFTVWVPISNLHVESEFHLGDVTFRTLSRAKLDEWLEQFKSGTPEEEVPNLELRFQQERLKLQGLAAAVTKVVAEGDYALRQALEKVDEATALLRLFHVSNLSPRISSYCRSLGMEEIQKYRAYTESTKGGVTMHGGLVGSSAGPWNISTTMLGEFRKSGLDHLDRLLSLKSRTEFQEQLLSALLVYTRNALAKQPIEKLIFILVGLESLLLKDEQEAIQQNIGERLAFAISQKPDERRRIVALTHDCYSCRSRFLHHGRDEHQIDLLSEFMKYAWIFIMRVIRSHQRFTTKAEFIRSIEEVKFA